MSEQALRHPRTTSGFVDVWPNPKVLRRLIITGRPDLKILAMPNFHESEWRSPKFKPLTDQQINDLTALLASWRERDLTTKE